MKTIYKYEFQITDEQTIEMPEGSKILSIQKQHGCFYIWAMVDTDKQKEPFSIAIIGTGNPLWCTDYDYAGTIIADPFVWHLFYKSRYK